MSASTKILPRKLNFPIAAVKLRRSLALKKQRPCTKCVELENANQVFRDENERMRAQLNLLRSYDEQDQESTELTHLRRQCALKQREVEKAQGELSLAKRRVAELESEIAAKDARIDSLTRKLFEASSEKGTLEIGQSTDEQNGDTADTGDSRSKPQGSSKRKRGGQPGGPRPGPRDHDHLPTDDDKTYELDESCCSDCGEQWVPFTTRESEQIEVTVRAYKRKVRRKKYRHFCKKKQCWATKTASAPRPLFPHSRYGISVWVFLLVNRYVLHIAMNRVCMMLKQHQLNMPQGTVYAGFHRIHQLIKPLIAEIKRHSREDKHHWHIDDTGWKVFVVIDEKSGYGWYLWVFLSDDVCVYILSPSRARKVPKSHLENSVGIVTSDRLPANKKLSDNIQNSYCWVHERREFRNLAKAYPEIAKLCMFFLDLIGGLFHHNVQRLLAESNSESSATSEAKLKSTLNQIYDACRKHLAKSDLHPELRRVFKGMIKDEEGLRLFFDIPSVPPDNNPAERALRGPVVGRKNSYGNHSKWGAEFTADMFSLSETLRLNNIDHNQFLTNYLQACADNNGQPPPNAANYLPWHRPPPQ